MHAFVNGHPLMTIATSISRIFLLQFGKSRRDLLYTFVFNTLAYYDVIIPGRESEIH